MKIFTVGQQIQPPTASPSFTSSLPCNVKHFLYCRHTSLVCETILTLILLRFLTWAQKIPCLGFGGHTVWENAEGDFLLIVLVENCWISPFHLGLFLLCVLRTLTSLRLYSQDFLWNGNVSGWKRLTARILNLPFTKDNLFNITYKKLCLMTALGPAGCHIHQHAEKQVYTTHSF